MRALSLSLAILAVPAVSYGAGPSLKVASQVRSESGTTGASTNGIATASSVTTTTDLSSGSALGPLAVRMGYDRLQPAYDRILITDRQGTTRALSAQFNGPEQTIRAGADLTFPAFNFSIDGTRTVGESAFPGHSASISATHDRYSTGTRFLAAFSRSDFASPRSYFIDPDTFRTRERPSRLLESQVKLGVEQALSERLRGRIQAIYALRPDRRPAKTAFETSFAWAFQDDKAALISLGTARESRGSALFDDRGFLSAYWLQTEIRWEPTYSWRLYGRLGTLLETETARGRLPRQRVGTDSVGLEARRTGGRLELGLSSLAAFSNTGYRNLQFGGNLTWLL